MIDEGAGGRDDEAPVAPPIPSFEALRAPRRRSAIDLLLPPAEPTVPVEPVKPADAVPPAPAARLRGPVPAPRPAEWGDLLRLGVRVGAHLTERLRGLLRG